MGFLHIFYDQRASTPSKVGGEYKLPDDWSTEPGQLCVVTDGNSHACVFMGGMDGKPTQARYITLAGDKGKKYDFGAD